MNEQPNIPVHREQMGAICASVWMNQSDGGDPYYVSTLSRTYRDPDTGEWKDTNSFGQRDLLVIALVAQRAALKISELNQADRRARSNDENESEPSPEATESTVAKSRDKQHTR